MIILDKNNLEIKNKSSEELMNELWDTILKYWNNKPKKSNV